MPRLMVTVRAMFLGEGVRFGGLRVWLCLVLGALIVLPGSAVAAESAVIDAAVGRGVDRLEAVQLASGSTGGRLVVRDTATSAEAVRLARPASGF